MAKNRKSRSSSHVNSNRPSAVKARANVIRGASGVRSDKQALDIAKAGSAPPKKKRKK